MIDKSGTASAQSRTGERSVTGNNRKSGPGSECPLAGQGEQTVPITTETLFGLHREILITHDGTLYRLRITSKDKLILTK